MPTNDDDEIYAALLTPPEPRPAPAPPTPFTVPELSTFLALITEDIDRLEAAASGRTTYTSRRMRELACRVRLHLDVARSGI